MKWESKGMMWDGGIGWSEDEAEMRVFFLIAAKQPSLCRSQVHLQSVQARARKESQSIHLSGPHCTTSYPRNSAPDALSTCPGNSILASSGALRACSRALRWRNHDRSIRGPVAIDVARPCCWAKSRIAKEIDLSNARLSFTLWNNPSYSSRGMGALPKDLGSVELDSSIVSYSSSP